MSIGNRAPDARLKSSLDIALLAAYHASRAQVELLANLANHASLMKDDEPWLIRLAHKQAVEAFTTLNSMIVDAGNDAGKKHLLSLLETGE